MPIAPLLDFFSGPSTPTPIYPNAPRSVKSYTRKYQKLAPILFNSFGPGIANSLASYEQQRAMRGINPLGKDQTIRIATAAQRNQTNIPKAESGLGDIFGNAVNDIFTLGSEVVKLPMHLVQQAQQLPQTFQQLPGKLAQGDVAGALQLPGINLIPGAYTLSNIVSGNYQEMIEHPVFTGLDILPYAKKPVTAGLKAARATPQVDAMAGAIRGTKPYAFMERSFGPKQRQLMSMTNRIRTEMAEASHPDAPVGRFGDIPEAQIQRRALGLRNKYPTIVADEQLQSQLHDTSTLTPDRIVDLPAEQQAYLSDFRGITNDLSKLAVERAEGLKFGEWVGGEEVLPTLQARTLFRSKQRRDLAQTISTVRERVLKPNITDPVTYARNAPDTFMKSGFDETSATARNTYSVKRRKQIAEGHARSLDMAGYDTTGLLDSIRQARTRADLGNVADQFNKWTPTSKPIVPDLDSILKTVDEQAKTGDRIAINAAESIKKGRLDDAVTYLQTISRRTGSTLFDNPTLAIDSLKRYKGASSYLDDTSAWNARRVAATERGYERTQQRNLPARFIPKQEELTKTGMRKYVGEQYSDSPDLPKLMQYVEDEMYDMLPEFRTGGSNLREVLKPIKDDAARAVVDLRRNGFDPLFIHRIGPGAEHATAIPSIGFRETTPSQVKARVGDGAPSSSNMQVALEHQGMEWLTQRGNLEAINEVGTRYGVNQADLIEQYMPAAKRRAAMDPTLDVKGHAQALMSKEWAPFDPSSYISPKAQLTFNAQNTWLPKGMVKNIEKMQKPYEFTGLWDPILNAFRTAVLPLSPRWHAYNIVGGYTMLSAETNPFTAMRYMGDFLELQRDLKAGRTPKIPDQMRVLLGKSSQEARDFTIRGGNDMGRWWERRSKTDDTTGMYMGQLSKIKEAGSKIVQKSFDINTFFDDAYRVMAYFYAHDKSVAGKLTKREAAAASDISKAMGITEAQAAGFNLSRRIMQNWDEITPFERTVVRGIFPFYSWMQHILRFTMRYPIDHPIRASILGSFARNELEDFGTALPQRFLNTFFLGHPDPNTGEVTGINVNGMNPFSDVANYFTLAGWTSSANPVFATALEQMGVDPRSGQTGLFPDTTFDPISGGLKLEAPNPALSLLYNTIPQSQVLATMLGASTEIKEVMRTNPEAAQRMIQSQLGFPLLWRDYNQVEEVAKAEKNREDVFRTEISESLKSGHYGKIEQYPALRPWLSQIKQFSQGTVQPYPTSVGI